MALSRAKTLLALGLGGLLALLAGYALTAGRYDLSLSQVVDYVLGQSAAGPAGMVVTGRWQAVARAMRVKTVFMGLSSCR